MSNTQESWYVRDKKDRLVGPVPTEQILRAVEVGRLVEITLCRKKGASQWRPLAEVEPFSKALHAYAERTDLIHFNCDCGNTIVMARQFAGRRARCAVCQETVRIPVAPGDKRAADGHRWTWWRLARWGVVPVAACLVMVLGLVWIGWSADEPDGGVDDVTDARPVKPAQVSRSVPRPKSVRTEPARPSAPAGNRTERSQTTAAPKPGEFARFWSLPGMTHPETWGELYVKNETFQQVNFELRSYVDKNGRTRKRLFPWVWSFNPGERGFVESDGKRVVASHARYTYSTKDGDRHYKKKYQGSGRFTIVIRDRELKKPDGYTREQIPGLMERAQQGNADAQAELGRLYTLGRGVPKNYSEALRWYRASAQQGNSKGEYGVGVAYDFEYGVRRDPRKAFQWYEKAARKGHVNAMYNVGISYIQGSGVRQDRSAALRWFDKAAAAGDEGAAQAVRRIRRSRPTNRPCGWCYGDGLMPCPCCQSRGGGDPRCGCCRGGKTSCSQCGGRG